MGRSFDTNCMPFNVYKRLKTKLKICNNKEKTMKKIIFCLLALLLGLLTPASQAELVLVENGKACMPIVVSETATPRTKEAAGELADYIEKTSDVRPEILTGCPDPRPDSAIWVGFQPALKDLFPEIDFTFEHPEEILIAANDHHVVIVGRDRWDPTQPDLLTGRKPIENWQQESGTINAIYTFLQDSLGVRWFWPGESGVDVLHKERIALAPFVYRYHPQILSRAGVFHYSGLGRGEGGGGDWARRQRLQLDSLTFSAGHGFADWWDRFHETHPEYFALQPDGTRGGGKTPYPSDRTVKMCKSNPALWDEWMRDVARQLEKNPFQTVFSAAANDSWASGYCICENCRAWDHPDGEKRMFTWQGLTQEYVSMSDRQVHFANVLGQRLAEAYPGKPYFVLIMAYGHSRPAPIGVVPAANVQVGSVANFLLDPNSLDQASSRGDRQRDQFLAWGKLAPNLFWRPNKARYMAATPLISLSQTIKDLRMVGESNVTGIFIDMLWEHWAIRGPFYYIMAQMAWNPQIDGEAMLEDYFQRCFGPAQDPIQSYWRFMESSWETWIVGKPDWPEVFTAAFFEEADGFLKQAEAAVVDVPEKYRQRVRMVRVGLEYTYWMTEARKAMIRFEKSVNKDLEAEAQARAIWMDHLHPLATNPETPHAFSWGRMRPGHGHNKKAPWCSPVSLFKYSW